MTFAALFGFIASLVKIFLSAGGPEWLKTHIAEGLTDEKVKDKVASLVVAPDPDRE